MTKTSNEIEHIRPGDWALLGVLTVLWSNSYLLYRFLDRSLAPTVVVFGRLAIGAAILNLVLAARRTPLRIAWRRWPAILTLGLINNAAPFTLIAYSEIRITGGLAATIGATAPLFSAIVLLARGSGSFDSSRLCALLLGLAGVAVATGSLASDVGGSQAGAIAAVLLASACYGLGSLYSMRFSREKPLETAAGQLTAATLIMAAVVAATGRWPSPRSLDLANGSALLAIGAACTALPYVLFYKIVGRLGPTNILLTTLMIPAATMLLGWLLLGDSVLPRQVVGLIMVMSSLLMIDGRLSMQIKRCRKARA